MAWGAGSAILVLAILAAFGAQRQVGELTSGWDEYWAEREQEVGETRLDAALQEMLAAGEAAADSLAGMARELAASQDVTAVERLRARHGVSAIALYDPRGQLIIWDGVHRGKVPEPAQRGEQRYMYRDLPLFGYLYVTAVASNGSVAMAAHLLRTDLSPDLGADVGDFSSEFLRETGESIRISAESPPVSEGVWELTVPGGERGGHEPERRPPDRQRSGHPHLRGAGRGKRDRGNQRGRGESPMPLWASAGEGEGRTHDEREDGRQRSLVRDPLEPSTRERLGTEAGLDEQNGQRKEHARHQTCRPERYLQPRSRKYGDHGEARQREEDESPERDGKRARKLEQTRVEEPC